MRSRKHHHLSSPGLLTTYLTLRSLHLLEPSSASYLILETTSPARFVTNSACTMIIEHDVGYFMLLAAIIPLVLPALLGLIAVAVYYCNLVARWVRFPAWFKGTMTCSSTRSSQNTDATHRQDPDLALTMMPSSVRQNLK